MRAEISLWKALQKYYKKELGIRLVLRIPSEDGQLYTKAPLYLRTRIRDPKYRLSIVDEEYALRNPLEALNKGDDVRLKIIK